MKNGRGGGREIGESRGGDRERECFFQPKRRRNPEIRLNVGYPGRGTVSLSLCSLRTAGSSSHYLDWRTPRAHPPRTHFDSHIQRVTVWCARTLVHPCIGHAGTWNDRKHMRVRAELCCPGWSRVQFDVYSIGWMILERERERESFVARDVGTTMNFNAWLNFD